MIDFDLVARFPLVQQGSGPCDPRAFLAVGVYAAYPRRALKRLHRALPRISGVLQSVSGRRKSP